MKQDSQEAIVRELEELAEAATLTQNVASLDHIHQRILTLCRELRARMPDLPRPRMVLCSICGRDEDNRIHDLAALKRTTDGGNSYHPFKPRTEAGPYLPLVPDVVCVETLLDGMCGFTRSAGIHRFKSLRSYHAFVHPVDERDDITVRALGYVSQFPIGDDTEEGNE